MRNMLTLFSTDTRGSFYSYLKFEIMFACYLLFDCMWICGGVFVTLPFCLFLPVTFSCSLIDPQPMNIHAQDDYTRSNPGSEWDDKKPPEHRKPPLHHWNKQIITESQNLPAQKCMQSYRRPHCSSCSNAECDWRQWRVTCGALIEKVCLMRDERGYNECFVIPWPQSTLKLTWLSWEGRGPLSCNCISTSLTIMQLNTGPLEDMRS